MKQFIIVISLLFFANINAQNDCWSYSLYGSSYYNYFDSDFSGECVFIDTLSNPNNSWQIGSPQKSTFNSASSLPNAIVTDTMLPYPVNDTSSFVITQIANLAYLLPPSIANGVSLSGKYSVETDSLNDFGLIEFSPDNGNTWFDIINDSLFSNAWGHNGGGSKPVLTGKSNGWKTLDFWPMYADSSFGILQGDTVKYRFTFISDSVLDSLDGLMFDSFIIESFVGVDNYTTAKIQTKVYPNPATNLVTLAFENPQQTAFELRVMNYLGEEVLKRAEIKESTIVLDLSDLDTGMYTYYLRNVKNANWSTGKIMKMK